LLGIVDETDDLLEGAVLVSEPITRSLPHSEVLLHYLNLFHQKHSLLLK
jgi:hypothetical protein